MGYHPITAVVKFMNEWYVGFTVDECPYGAIGTSRVFQDKGEALLYASENPSDEGIRCFEPYHYALCKELMEQDLPAKLQSVVAQEWSKCQERETCLLDALKEHNLELRDDSTVCLAYLSGDIHDLDFVVFQVGKWNFLHTKTIYRRLRYHTHAEQKALAHYRAQNPTLHEVPEFLRSLFTTGESV